MNQLMASTDAASVLVVEDHADTRAGYEVFLQSCGFAVQAVADGSQALRYMRTQPAPDVLIMDMGLPVVDGWSAVRALRASVAFDVLPIIAVTGHVYATDRQRAKDLGCDGFLAKPFALHALALEIQRVLGERWTSRAQLRADSARNREEQARLREQLIVARARLTVAAATLQQRRADLASTLVQLKRLAQPATA
jgi:CheY-like chemotaxis protein